MMFGSILPRNKARRPYDTPGIGGGLPGAIDPANMDFGMQGQIPRANIGMDQPAAKPSFMGQGGAGRAIAGTIGDTLMQYNGMDPIYAPQQAAQQQQALQAQQAQAERQNKRDDWRWQFDYTQANKAKDPASLQYFDDNAGNRYSYNPATGEQSLIFTDPNDRTYLQDGQLVTVPNVVRQGQAGNALPTKPVGKLTPLGGGPASQAPGGFPY